MQEDLLQLARKVLYDEAQSINLVANDLDSEFLVAVDLIFKCYGKVVVTGIGKSGHIGRKIAATLASTGTPAFFVHAAEAGHGDLGMISDKDVVIALSQSGSSDEVINCVTFVKRFNAKVVAITGNKLSRLGVLSNTVIESRIDSEACILGIAPTSSTTIQLALGDALAMAVLAKKGFTKEDFAKTHPLGSLGRRYFLKVRDVMRPIKELPYSKPNTLLLNVIPQMALGRMGAVLILEDKSLRGIFTDSDLRKIIVSSSGDFDKKLKMPVQDFMSRSPRTIDCNSLASEALLLFEKKKIGRIACVDGDQIVGLIAWHDLLQHKVA